MAEVVGQEHCGDTLPWPYRSQSKMILTAEVKIKWKLAQWITNIVKTYPLTF